MNWKMPAIAAAVGVLLGIAIEYAIMKPKPSTAAKAETYAAQVRQSDGSVVAEKKPEKREDVKTPHELPKDSRLERTGETVFQPSAEAMARTSGERQQDAGASAGATFPGFRIDWSLVETKDNGKRMIWSSPDGTITGATDLPIVDDANPTPRELKWAAGPLWNPLEKTFGGMVQRQTGPFILGAQLQQVRASQTISTSAPSRWSGNVFALWKF